MKKNLFISFLFGFIISLLLTLAAKFDFFRGIEAGLYDIAFQKRGEIGIDENIITIDIDDPAIESIGRWPWPLSVHRALLEFLALYGTKTVIFTDMDFSIKNDTGISMAKRDEMGKSIINGWSESDGDIDYFSSIVNEKEGFYRALKESGNAYFTFPFKIPQLPERNEERKELAKVMVKNYSNEKKEFMALLSKTAGLPSRIYDNTVAVDIIPQDKGIIEFSKGTGFNNIFPDKDGIVRRYLLMADFHNHTYPSIGTVIASDILGYKEIISRKGEVILHSAEGNNGEVRIPVNNKGEMLINWTGGYENSFTHIAFNMITEFIAYQITKEELKYYSIGEFENIMDLREILINILLRSNLVSNEKSDQIGTIIFISYLIERYLIAYPDISVNEVLKAIGLPDEPMWSEIGLAIYMNNMVYMKYKETGEIPEYPDILKNSIISQYLSDNAKNFNKGVGFYDDTGSLSSFHLKDQYNRIVFNIKNDIVENVRPLFFAAPVFLLKGDLEIAVTPDFFKEKIIFYGLTATGLTAQHPTPFSAAHPALDTLPNVINTITKKAFLKEMSLLWEYFLCLLFTTFMFIIILTITPVRGFFLMISLLVFHVSLSWFMFSKNSFLIPSVQPLAGLVVSYLLAVLFRYIRDMKERKKVRQMFSTMVSPDVLRIMESNPKGLSLSGELREATMFSSDVAGFTTISEGVTSEELANILNIYLTSMSNIIMSFNGFVEKYEGDAIKADFGVPIEDQGHAWKACLAALCQQEELQVIQMAILFRYGVNISVRMGINTGFIMAGNIGSERRMQYSVLGETAEETEKLEQANKLFDTGIMIDHNTYIKSKEFIYARYLNDLIIGDHRHRVPVYELTGWNKERFREFRRGSPVPEPVIESLKDMLPEMILAYHEYYESKSLPESEMLREFRNLFRGLKNRALDYMRLININDVASLLKGFAKLRTELGTSASEMDRPVPEISALADQESDECEVIINKWRREAGYFSAALTTLLNDGNESKESEWVNVTDTLSKGVESLNKRISLTKNGGEIGMVISKHLREVIIDWRNISYSFESAKLRNDITVIESEIKKVLADFVDGLKGREEEYHDFFSDLCIVSHKQFEAFGFFSEALESYLRGEQETALLKFNKTLSVLPDDGPSLNYLKRINELKKSPPAKEWDGAWIQD